MDYFESAEDETINKDRALYELKRHGVESETAQFLAEIGDKAVYNAQDVLQWLGY